MKEPESVRFNYKPETRGKIKYYGLQFQESRLEDPEWPKFRNSHASYLPISAIEDGEWSNLFWGRLSILTFPPKKEGEEPRHIFMKTESMEWVTSDNLEEYKKYWEIK